MTGLQSPQTSHNLRYPDYTVPKSVFVRLLLAALTGQRRRFKTHAGQMIKGICPPLRVLGEAHIPQIGPGLITVNHYSRPGFWSPWFPAAISAVVPVDIHWTMTSAWTYPGRRFGWFYRWLSAQMLMHVARVYGFNTMPPMPPAPEEIKDRAAGVARLVHYARANPQALLALAPEGGDSPGGVLGMPPAGSGRLALALARMGLQFYPVGVYEEDGCFFIHFGVPYGLEGGAGDAWASTYVMERIAACLPGRLRGKFAR